ncbi:hypothetical protein V8C86DRAFT_2587903 [Haematococcus lacustris]
MQPTPHLPTNPPTTSVSPPSAGPTPSVPSAGRSTGSTIAPSMPGSQTAVAPKLAGPAPAVPETSDVESAGSAASKDETGCPEVLSETHPDPELPTNGEPGPQLQYRMMKQWFARLESRLGTAEQPVDGGQPSVNKSPRQWLGRIIPAFAKRPPSKTKDRSLLPRGLTVRGSWLQRGFTARSTAKTAQPATTHLAGDPMPLPLPILTEEEDAESASASGGSGNRQSDVDTCTGRGGSNELSLFPPSIQPVGSGSSLSGNGGARSSSSSGKAGANGRRRKGQRQRLA